MKRKTHLFERGSWLNKKQEVNIIDAIKTTCRKYSKEKTGKRPIMNINLVRL